jgi:hypothetical protein
MKRGRHTQTGKFLLESGFCLKLVVRPQSVTTTFELRENMGTKTAGDTSTFAGACE